MSTSPSDSMMLGCMCLHAPGQSRHAPAKHTATFGGAIIVRGRALVTRRVRAASRLYRKAPRTGDEERGGSLSQTMVVIHSRCSKV